MLYIIGLGLNDEKDISLKGMEAMRKCDEIYCEFYTNKWHGSLQALEDMAGKKIITLDRQQTESNFLFERANDCIVALLVPGDPLSATTHYQLLAECKKGGIHTEIVHSSSILTAVAESGIDLYKFGRTTTLPKDRDPESPYEMIRENKKAGLHTIVLLDIDMTSGKGTDAMLRHKSIEKDEMIVACFMLGGDRKILYDTAANIIQRNITDVPCCIVVPGSLNEKEQEFLELWKTSKTR